MASMNPSIAPHGLGHRTMARMFDTRGGRLVLATIGWVSLALGIVTLFVPLLPTTLFLLVALWALSQSSAPGYRWLREHPTLGPTMREWDDHGVIAPRAKLLSIAGLAWSGCIVGFFADGGWIVSAVFGIVLLAAAVYIVTRPGNPGNPATP
jgi:uncharacterized protein